MKKKWLIIIGIVLLLLLLRMFGIDQIIDDNIKLFMDLKKDYGYTLLLLTIPLSILQGIITIFPIITIITFHALIFGITEGLIYSFIGSFLGSIISFVLGRYLFSDWSEKVWQKNQEKYKKLEEYFHQYGTWGLILLRTIPVMPSNMISLMAALSPISIRSYVWASIIGNISMVWILGIIGLSVTLSDSSQMIIGYIIFLISLLIIFFIQLYYHHKKEASIKLEDNISYKRFK